MSKRVQIEGQRFNRFIVLKYLRNYQNHSIYLCRCDCGIVKEVSGNFLRRGRTKSCGCHNREVQKQKTLNKNHNANKLSSIHHSMMQRCYWVKHPGYKDYGAKGVLVCEEWYQMSLFREWCFNNGWKPGLQIDRINTVGNYTPENCRFVTRKQNMNNTRRTRFYTFNEMTGTISQIAEKMGLRYEQVRSKIRKMERASRKCPLP